MRMQLRPLVLAALLLMAAGCSTTGQAPATLRPISAWTEGANSARLHYLDFGGRGDPVILLAGAGNTAWIYEDFGRMLARGHRVLALTRRGHGESAYPPTGYDPDTLAEDLRLFMDRQGIRRAALVGHSLAGAELTYFASKYPQRVSALVYLDAAYDRSIQAAVSRADPAPPAPPSAADRTSVASFLQYVRRTRPDLARYWADPVERDLAASVAIRPEGGAGWRTSNAIFSQLVAGASASPPDYSRITAPVLAIYSVEQLDYRLGPDASPEQRAALSAFANGPRSAWRQTSIDQLRRQLPNARIVEMDAGHHLFIHRLEETLRLVRDFLAHNRLPRR